MNYVSSPVDSKQQSRISPEERARRQAAIQYAYASARLEGLEPSEFARKMNDRYISGEITRQELTSAIVAHSAP